MNELNVTMKLDPHTTKWIVVIDDKSFVASSWGEAEQLARQAVQELKLRARTEGIGQQ